VERALEVIAPILGVRGPPLGSWVSRWVDALPVFDDAHRARVRVVEDAVAAQSVFLAGSAFHGAGIDAAALSAERAAFRIVGS
jgi:oxygen-dependent protoporphyrinogen oxidase